MTGGTSGLPATVTRGFATAWKHRCHTRRAARERARLKKAAHKASRRSRNGDFRRADRRDVI